MMGQLPVGAVEPRGHGPTLPVYTRPSSGLTFVMLLVGGMVANVSGKEAGDAGSCL